MRTRVILVTLLLALLALPVAVYAQATDPVSVTEKHVEAVNKGEVNEAQTVMAEDATVTVPQATSGEEEEEAEAEPEAQTTYAGSAEYQAWLDAQAAANAQTTLSECAAEGQVVTCNASYTSEALKAKGVDVLEGELQVTVVEGQIQAYAFTLSAASVTKLGAAAAEPEAMPVSGGGPTQGIVYILGVLAVLGLLIAGASSAFRSAKN